MKSIGGSIFHKDNLINLGQYFKEFITTEKFMISEVFLTATNLYYSIYTFVQINEIAKQAKDFRVQLKEIWDKFYKHVCDINYIKFLETGCDPKMIAEKILNDVNSDIKNLQELIKNINTAIEQNDNHKNYSGVGMVFSFVLVGIGITASIVSGMGGSAIAAVAHAANAAGNVASGAIYITNIVESSKVAEELNQVLNESLETKELFKRLLDEVKIKIENSKKLINTKCYLPNYRDC